jgi:hypothetical protein
MITPGQKDEKRRAVILNVSDANRPETTSLIEAL